jgi:hypothetical protein
LFQGDRAAEALIGVFGDGAAESVPLDPLETGMPLGLDPGP